MYDWDWVKKQQKDYSAPAEPCHAFTFFLTLHLSPFTLTTADRERTQRAFKSDSRDLKIVAKKTPEPFKS